MPAGWAEGAEGAAASPEGAPASPEAGWWTSFGDAELNATVERALASNLDLEMAWERLVQAETQVDAQVSGYWPQANFQATTSKTRIDVADVASSTTGQYQVSVPLSWELDLWGRIGSNVKATELEVAAARDDVSALAITLAAQVTEEWFTLLEARARRRILGEQLALQERWLELLEARFSYGTATALDMLQQRDQIQTIRGQLALVDGQEQASRNRLSVLVGAPAGAWQAGGGDALPSVPSVPASGVPAELLEQRPDLRAARRRVEASDHRVSAAVAQYLPTLRLTGSLALNAVALEDLLKTLISSVSATVGLPLLDGGGRDATLRRAESTMRVQLLAYTQTFLTAVRDVETAMVQERHQRSNIAELERQVELSRASLEAARVRYRDGGEDFLRVLTAQTSVQRAELNLLAAQRQLLSHRVQLHRALGGSFGDQLSRPEELK